MYGLTTYPSIRLCYWVWQKTPDKTNQRRQVKEKLTSKQGLIKYPYHGSKIWTRALAPCRTHYLPVERTSTDSNLVDILEVSCIHPHFFAYLSLSMLAFIRYDASGGLDRKWTKIGYQQKLIDFQF